MKRIRILLALLLTAMLLSSLAFFTEAEQEREGEWQADLLKLMDPADVPETTQIEYRNTYAEDAAVETHDIACEITVNGVTYGCEFVFEVSGDAVSDWSSVQTWLGGIVTDAARTAGSDSQSLAKAVDKAISAARKGVQPDGSGALPAWAAPEIAVKVIRVSTPFYPELSVGKNGEATKRLQQRLIELGFLSGKADGYFGEQTRSAVEALENYVRELEQELIDARPAATAEPTRTATPAATQENRLPESTHELTLVPRETRAATQAPSPEPTPTPMDVAEDAVKLEPVTQADGVADALLQAYLYSDAYRPATRALEREDGGDDVRRLQQRLLGLGCSVSAPDGSYGGDTARAVCIFQYYNDLEQTGEADMETLNRIFSAEAKAPDYAMLSVGSGGDAVRTLQTRLRELGFTNVGTDGDYGAGTQRAVETLQTSMREL